MDRKIALSAAGALAMTTAAGVLALSMTVGQASTADPAPAPADVTTEYQVVRVPASELADLTTTTISAGEIVYEVVYEEAPAPAYDDEAYEDHDDDEYETAGEYEDDDDEYSEHEEDDDD